MAITWIIVIDIIVAIATFFAVPSVFLIINYFNFELPYTKYLISNDVIKPSIKKQLLGVELFSCLITFIIGNGLCILGAYFARPSGYIVYFIVAVVVLLFFHPTKDRYSISQYNIEKYVKRHSICMNMDKYNEII